MSTTAIYAEVSGEEQATFAKRYWGLSDCALCRILSLRRTNPNHAIFFNFACGKRSGAQNDNAEDKPLTPLENLCLLRLVPCGIQLAD